MTLIQRAILLLATPVLAQFIFVLFLLLAFHKVEEITFKDLQFRTQTSELMGISTLSYRAVGLIGTYAFSREQPVLASFDTVYLKLGKKAEYLEILSRATPGDKSLETAAKTFRKLLNTLHEVRQLLAMNLDLRENRKLSALELDSDMEVMLSDLESTLSQRARVGLEESKRIETTRTLFLSAVLVGFAANMLVSVVLLTTFSRSFARRFQGIVENTHRLPQGLPLNPQIEGNDELAQLDRFFHEMTKELKIIQERKDQLISMVSHDMRSPLTALQMSLQSINAGTYGELSQAIAVRLERSVGQVRRLTGLVNDILDLEKLRSGKLQLKLGLVDLQSVGAECIAELEPIAAGLKVSIANKFDSHLVLADKERLVQIFINLIGNALKFSPAGSTIQLEAAPQGEFLKIMIRDQGPGVPEEFRDTIFLPFEQVPDDKRPQKGSTGLGLPITKMLVDLHGGKIGVDCSGQGSCFWFTLPMPETEKL